MFRVAVASTFIMAMSLSVIAAEPSPEAVTRQTEAQVKLVSPSICPVLCAQNEDRNYSHNGIVDLLEDVISEMGYYLVIEFSSDSRSRNTAAMGLSDLTLGSPEDLKKNSRLDIVEQPVGSTPIVIAYSPKRPIQINDLQDLTQYKTVFSKLLSHKAPPSFQPILNTMKASGEVHMVDPQNFAYNALKAIHNGDADFIALPLARYEDAVQRLQRHMPTAEFSILEPANVPGYNINIAFSKKSWLSDEEKTKIQQAIASFNSEQ